MGTAGLPGDLCRLRSNAGDLPFYTMTNPNPPPEQPEASAHKMTLHEREHDGSLYIEQGSPASGRHQAFDIHCDRKTAEAMVYAYNELAAVRCELERARADRARLWRALKDECCVNPETAYRIVLLNEEQFMRVFDATMTGMTRNGEIK